MTLSDWVLDNSRNHILRMFEHAKAVRYDAHLAYLQSLPFYSLYQHYNGNPPLRPNELQYLQGQLRNADTNLRIGVDADWRTACLAYPDTLDYYFRMVEIRLPNDKDPGVVRPEFGRRTIRRDSGHSDRVVSKKDRGR